MANGGITAYLGGEKSCAGCDFLIRTEEGPLYCGLQNILTYPMDEAAPRPLHSTSYNAKRPKSLAMRTYRSAYCTYALANVDKVKMKLIKAGPHAG